MNKQVRLVLFTAFFLIFHSDLYAQKIIMSGTYKGKNLYIYNQYCSDSTYCLEKILVNGKEIKVKLSTGGVQIPLADFKIGEKLLVTLYHLPDCQPKFLNPQVINNSPFSFKEIKIENNTVQFETLREKPEAVFSLYRWENQTWNEESSYTIPNSRYGSRYSFSVRTTSQKYRIKYLDLKTGEMHFSPEISFPVDLN